jgi:hypothetical protein
VLMPKKDDAQGRHGWRGQNSTGEICEKLPVKL